MFPREPRNKITGSIRFFLHTHTHRKKMCSLAVDVNLTSK